MGFKTPALHFPALLLGLTLSLNLAACAKVNFSNYESPSVGGLGNTEVRETLRTIQPTLAVRGMACLMCHADVRSSILTDFGLGRSYYLGGTARFDQDQSWYNNLASTWQTARNIQGTVYVPDAKVTTTAQAVLGDSYANKPLLSIKEFMETPYVPKWNYDSNNSSQSMAARVIPVSGSERIVAKSYVKIRAPGSAEILALAPGIGGASFVRANSSSAVQLVSKSNSKGKYVANIESTALDCAKGDIVVNGTLFLRNLKVNAANGCRLYVNGNVFIEGAISYEGDTTNANLQITSSRAIVMGFDESSLNRRVVSDARGVEVSADISFSAIAQKLVADASMLGDLKDGGSTTINFSGLLLNAPTVHSRYLGNVKGTIIADAALFSVGAFHFEYDPVFSQVGVLPLIKESVLEAK